jgi:hypothetical protein
MRKTITLLLWVPKSILLIILFVWPCMILQLAYSIFWWAITGEDHVFDLHAPMNWATTGWRWKMLRWPFRWEE